MPQCPKERQNRKDRNCGPDQEQIDPDVRLWRPPLNDRFPDRVSQPGTHRYQERLRIPRSAECCGSQHEVSCDKRQRDPADDERFADEQCR